MPKNKREIAPELKRAEICGVALKLFCERGYEGTSMAYIAEALQVSQNTIYWYFGNKDQLLMAVVDERLQAAAREYVALPDSSIAVRLQWMLQWTRGMGGLINIVHGRVPVSDGVRQWHEALHQRLIRFFVDRLRLRGVSESQAEVVVHTALFAFEGVATHPIGEEAAAKVFDFLESAIRAVSAPDVLTPARGQAAEPEIQSAS